ncbi:uncharacterized protein LOC113231709 [Hyposmocoma kahamanoa]|uniref:uncharacterized protein LOC113231709 n=1 Tax=Hyposmocoma kahamanoa TaxID=1477025 RepID=UPI000E6D9F63|nr:uncharacterized protein LOC113231709 [Hyposmocoma kahamanoa]
MPRENILILPFSLLLMFGQLKITYAVFESEADQKFTDAKIIAETTLTDFFMLYWNCVTTTMPKQRFLVDNLQTFILSPARTTVGFAPKFIKNRKFFANLINTKFYKSMLQQDENTVKMNLIKKLEFCDEMIMDQNLLKEFYDREVDQTKLKK